MQKDDGYGQELALRQLTEKDHLTDIQYEQISKLIYSTDEYIYPALFEGEESGEKNAVLVLSHLLKQGTDRMFNRENIFICLKDEEIIGIILWKKGTLIWDHTRFFNAALEIGVHLIETNVIAVKENYVEDRYVEDGLNVLDQLSLINICVDATQRGKGVGEYMLKGFIKQHLSEPMELCVLASNKSAIHLYEKCNFSTVTSYKGFSMGEENPTCYKMERAGWV